MASKNKHTDDPSALTMRVWAIEARHKGLDDGGQPFGWMIIDLGVDGKTTEADVVWRCKFFSEERVTSNFRYRAATLTFDDDGGRATIY